MSCKFNRTRNQIYQREWMMRMKNGRIEKKMEFNMILSRADALPFLNKCEVWKHVTSIAISNKLRTFVRIKWKHWFLRLFTLQMNEKTTNSTKLWKICGNRTEHLKWQQSSHLSIDFVEICIRVSLPKYAMAFFATINLNYQKLLSRIYGTRLRIWFLFRDSSNSSMRIATIYLADWSFAYVKY